MAGMADGPNFDIARRGYDIDQVHEFLIRQAEAWRTELYRATRRIEELQTDLARLGELEVEVEQSRSQREALTMSFHSAAQARDEMLLTAEAEIGKKRAEVEQQAAQILAEARAEAATILADAEREANDVRFTARARTDELMQAQQSELMARKAELDESHNNAVARYRSTEESLIENIRELNSMREALVVGLEAIANGGLAALEDVSEQLAAVGVGEDTTAVHRLVDRRPTDPERFSWDDNRTNGQLSTG